MNVYPSVVVELVAALTVLVAWWVFLGKHRPFVRGYYRENCYPASSNTTDGSRNASEITIMMATTHYGDDLVPEIMDNCPKRCRLVSYKKFPDEVTTATALIFHLVLTDLDWRWFRCLKSRRNPKQIWAVYSMETPETLRAMLPVIADRRFQVFDNTFNMTITYRRDSDVYSPYSGVVGYEQIAGTSLGNTFVPLKGKRHIAAVISNCNSQFYDRLGTLKELEALGLQVDIYGSCGNLTCAGRASQECYEFLESRYLFYASFENSLCRDYVSEKLWNILGYNMVPIVVGGADYSAIAPPNSFINLHSFKSAETLANFIWRLANNEMEYNSYFDWKRKYRIVKSQESMFCRFCKKLHEIGPQSPYIGRVYHDFEGWFVEAGKCAAAGTIYSGQM